MTPSKERALQALITEKDKQTAAIAAGISCRTLSNYLNDSEFKAAYDAAFGVMISNATRQAQNAMGTALNVLQEVAENMDETGATRVAAARSILEYSLKLTEFNDITRYIEETG